MPEQSPHHAAEDAVGNGQSEIVLTGASQCLCAHEQRGLHRSGPRDEIDPWPGDRRRVVDSWFRNTGFPPTAEMPLDERACLCRRDVAGERDHRMIGHIVRTMELSQCLRRHRIEHGGRRMHAARRVRPEHRQVERSLARIPDSFCSVRTPPWCVSGAIPLQRRKGRVENMSVATSRQLRKALREGLPNICALVDDVPLVTNKWPPSSRVPRISAPSCASVPSRIIAAAKLASPGAVRRIVVSARTRNDELKAHLRRAVVLQHHQAESVRQHDLFRLWQCDSEDLLRHRSSSLEHHLGRWRRLVGLLRRGRARARRAPRRLRRAPPCGASARAS